MKYFLAPLEDNSDNALRELCYESGADLTFTEMTKIDGLVRKNKATLRKIEINSNVPTQIQIVGSKEDSLSQFLSDFVPHDSFKGFNLNLGCPSPKIIGAGQGCAMMKRTAKINRFIDIIRKKDYKVSLKIRLGLNNFEKEKKVYLNLIKNTNADFYVVHARHGKEHYKTKADFSVYPECVETGKEIIANGDITTREMVSNLEKVGVKGVMIGRAAIYNPAIFAMLKGKPQPDPELLRKQYLEKTKKFHSQSKYVYNVLARIGRKESMDKKKLQLYLHSQG